MPPPSATEIGCGGSDIHDQHRLGQNIVADLEMLGLAGTDQSRTRLGNNADRRIACILEQLSVTLPCCLVPAGRAADIETAVLFFDQAAAHIELTQHTCRK